MYLLAMAISGITCCYGSFVAMAAVTCIYDLAMTLTEKIMSLHSKQEFKFLFNKAHSDSFSNSDHFGPFQILTYFYTTIDMVSSFGMLLKVESF